MTGLEDVGGGLRIPRDMERDLRHAMDLESPFLSPAMPRRKLTCEIDDGNSADDEVSLEEDLSFPFSPEDCNQMAKIFGLGILSKDPSGTDVGATQLDKSVDLFEYTGQSVHDDIFQDIFELDESELNLPSWLLPKANVATESQAIPDFKIDVVHEVSTSFRSLPSKLTIEAPNDETCVDQKFDFYL